MAAAVVDSLEIAHLVRGLCLLLLLLDLPVLAWYEGDKRRMRGIIFNTHGLGDLAICNTSPKMSGCWLM